MMSLAVPVLILTALAATNAAYIESVAANVDSKSSSSSQSPERKHEPFVPMVSFLCGYRNKYIDKNGEWQDDPSSAASCLQGKYDILKYCKRVYPNEEITNIVEYGHMVHIDKWCKEKGESCKHQAFVRPYRCIVGEFVTESLQVPSKCLFSHVAGKNMCNDYKYWNMKAESECGLKINENSGHSMKLRSFAILDPCGLGMFRGVEYVCCPKSVEDAVEKVVTLQKDTDEDDYDDEEEEDDDASKDNDKTKDSDKSEQDPYFKDDSTANEHDRFRDAEERLEKKHRKKVTKVITEWSELFERYNKMKDKDPKGAEEYKREMTSKFRRTVASLEEENKEQRTQIEEVHDERVQAALNEKKRQATHDYRAALAVHVGSANKNNVLTTLKNYIKAEEKDRTHMLNRYRHLLRSDPEQATSFEPVLLHRLRYIDLRINGTLAMLRDFPELEKQVRPIAIEFWNEYRRENTPEVSNGEPSLLGGDEKNVRLIRLYKETYERNHPSVQSAFGEIKADIEKKVEEATTTTPAPTTTAPVVHHIVSLKEAINGKEKEEDSDEDQFDDDEESSSSDASMETTQKSPESKKLALDVEIKPLSPMKIDTDVAKNKKKVDDAVPAKVLEHPSAKDEDEDSDNSDDEEGEYLESNDKKPKNKAEKMLRERQMSINIEPIVSAASRLHEELLDESPPAYARHDLLVADNDEFQEQNYMPRSWTSHTNFAIGFIACVFAVLLVALFAKRRSRHPGFIEVDVCTPEDRHMKGLQVNGYENPTFAATYRNEC
jgi:amyloid beta A4 protein